MSYHLTAMFATVMHNLKSRNNVGTIIRTHVAFNGTELTFVGQAPTLNVATTAVLAIYEYHPNNQNSSPISQNKFIFDAIRTPIPV